MTERYLIASRAFIFLDEWLSYLLLLYLATHNHWVLFALVLLPVVLFNLIGYTRHWEWEKRVFGTSESVQSDTDANTSPSYTQTI